MGHLCCFVRDEGLDQGTNHSGTSSDSSAWQEHSGWGRFLDIGTLGSTPNPLHTSPLHKRPPWVSSPGKAGRCPQLRSWPGYGWPCPGHPQPAAAQVGVFSAWGRVGGRGQGPEAKHWRWQPCCPVLPRPSWAARFRARRAETGCLYLAGQPEPRQVAKGRVAETKPQ